MVSNRVTREFLNEQVSAHARRDVTPLSANWTVGEALEHMRREPPGGRVIYFYVSDDHGKLVGVVPTRRLLLSPPDAKLADIMIRRVIAVPASATIMEACEFFTLYRLLAFPVVDDERRLIGVIDVELYTEELTEELGSEEAPRIGNDVFELIGVHLTEAQQASPTQAARGRFPWLLCNIGAGLAAAWLSSRFTDVLTWRHAVLALFITVVLTLSESVATQSVTLAVGRLRSHTTSGNRAWQHGLIEGWTGLLLGIACAGVVAAVAGIWLGDGTITAILLLSIMLAVAGSAGIGYAVPTLLHRLHWNPQVAAGPVSLALADLLTLMIYFNLARLFM